MKGTNVNHSYRPMRTNPQRLKDGIQKLHQAIADDEIARQKKLSGLPKDWSNRLIKNKMALVTG